jgi:hypothetical protein
LECYRWSITLQINSWQGAGKVALNTILPDADAGQFCLTNVSSNNAPAPCDNGATNLIVAILVRLVQLQMYPNATGLGTPTNSYGFLRFSGKELIKQIQ